MDKKFQLLSILPIVLLCAVTVAAQSSGRKAKPDFSGVWVLDEAKSKELENKLFKKKPIAPDASRKTTTTLVIEHSDPEFRMSQTVTNERFDEQGNLIDKVEGQPAVSVFYTDKRGSKDQKDKDSPEPFAKWDGKNILVNTPVSKEKRQKSITTFSLSKDGTVLTVSTVSFVEKPSSFGSASGYVFPILIRKQIYKKVSWADK
ncbi:MAG: hypothetical protein KF685_08745 [Acidobacteria bacterium]|nr:hypothetical protein [Acidobacteriota bacterium]